MKIYTRVPPSVTSSHGQPVEATTKSEQKLRWAPPAVGTSGPQPENRGSAKWGPEYRINVVKEIWVNIAVQLVSAFFVSVSLSHTYRISILSKNLDLYFHIKKVQCLFIMPWYNIDFILNIKTYFSVHIIHSSVFSILSHQKFDDWPLFKFSVLFAAIIISLKTNILWD